MSVLSLNSATKATSIFSTNVKTEFYSEGEQKQPGWALRQTTAKKKVTRRQWKQRANKGNCVFLFRAASVHIDVFFYSSLERVNYQHSAFLPAPTQIQQVPPRYKAQDIHVLLGNRRTHLCNRRYQYTILHPRAPFVKVITINMAGTLCTTESSIRREGEGGLGEKYKKKRTRNVTQPKSSNNSSNPESSSSVSPRLLNVLHCTSPPLAPHWQAVESHNHPNTFLLYL